LRESLSAILTGRSPFRFHDGNLDFRGLDAADLSDYAGQLVLWPMRNDALSVRRLFEALCSGVVPVVLPKATAPQKLIDLKAKYPGFGFFNGRAIEAAAEPARADERAFLVLMTSGSTGAPKLLAVDEQSLWRGIAAIHAAQSLENVASTGIMLPLAYSYALVNQLLWAATYGRECFCLPGLIDPAGTLENIREHDVQMLCLVAHQIRTLRSMGLHEEQLDSVRVVNFAGAPFPMQSLPELKRMFPRAWLFNNYGCTEAMPRLTVTRVHDESHPVTLVGKAIGSIELRIASREAVGPIEFRGSSTSLGLVQRDGSIQPHGDWIASGDLGRMQDGQLHVLGRHDQVIKVAGERFSLMEIENALLATGFEQALVWQDTNDESGPVVAIVRAVTPIASAQIARQLRQRLPQPLWPKAIFAADRWPLTAGGKTDRVVLQRQAADRSLPLIFPAM